MVDVPLRRPLVLVFAGVLLAAACAGDPPEHSLASRGPSLPAANAVTAPLLPTDAYQLPSFTVADYARLLTQLRGTPVVVNMWGSWCPPCRGEAPLFAEAHAEFGDRVQFLGIDIEDGREAAIAFMREFGWSFPSIVDPTVPSRFRTELGFVGQPNTLFYAASGELVKTWQGPITEEGLREGVARILASA